MRLGKKPIFDHLTLEAAIHGTSQGPRDEAAAFFARRCYLTSSLLLAFTIFLDLLFRMPSSWPLMAIASVCYAAHYCERRFAFAIAGIASLYVAWSTSRADLSIGSFFVNAVFALGVMLGLIHMIALFEHRHRQTLEFAAHDGLTGAINRQTGEEMARVAIRNALFRCTPLCIAMIDCDKFKKLNDIHGHAYGDRVLVKLVDVLQHALGSSGFVCRRGGDEFLLVSSRTRAELEHTLNKAAEQFNDATLVMGNVASFSYGIGTVGVNGVDLQTVTLAADEDMYLRKLTFVYGLSLIESAI